MCKMIIYSSLYLTVCVLKSSVEYDCKKWSVYYKDLGFLWLFSAGFWGTANPLGESMNLSMILYSVAVKIKYQQQK